MTMVEMIVRDALIRIATESFNEGAVEVLQRVRDDIAKMCLEDQSEYNSGFNRACYTAMVKIEEVMNLYL